jgi:phosphohistidine phosphatase
MSELAGRTLVLLRHAKAEHPANVADTERPLTPRGHADAGAAGAWLAAQGVVPDLVLCSPSRRTRETWHAVAMALGGDATGVTAAYDPALYDADSARGLLDLLVATDPAVRVLLLIGHNPTMSALSALLDPKGGEPDGLRTAGLAVHAVSGDWSALAPGKAKVQAWHTARA